MTENQNAGSEPPASSPSRPSSHGRSRRYRGRRRPRAPRAQDPKAADTALAAEASATVVTERSPGADTAEGVERISDRIGEPLPETWQEPGGAADEGVRAPGPEPSTEPDPAAATPEAVAESVLSTVEPGITPVPQIEEPEEKGSPIERAIHKVHFVMKELREALDQMEEVLELLEDAERQQITDEREIKALRKSLEGLHRGRSPGGPRHHSPHSSSGR